MKSTTWGIIGPGKIANKFAIALTLVENAKLGAVASRDLSKAQAFASQHATPGAPIPRAYGSYEELVTDPEIDAIYIATPHGYHAEQAILCLQHGKAVLCEKPMALSGRQVGLMVDAARSHRTFLMEAMWTRFLPMIEKIDSIIAEGQIGALQYVRADFGFLAPFNPEGRLYNLRLGGGALLDIGVYPLFLALHLLGEPERIVATGHRAPTGSDDTCHAILEYPANGSATNPSTTGDSTTTPSAVVSCTLTCQTGITAEIAGTAGMIRIPTAWYKNDHFVLQRTGEEPQTIQLEPMVNGFEYQIREVMKCMEEGLIESPKMSLEFSLMLARTMDTIRVQLGVKYPTE
ncbi:MAG: Gfo/Idh/MocA family oxidoreductase [Bacteroidetes bacterium]|nr:Gfo/Idh/MocA family oxidoreductase [Bacteroidota bacterium]